MRTLRHISIVFMLGITWRRVVRMTPRLLCPQGKRLLYILYKRLGDLRGYIDAVKREVALAVN
jgi:hypothetical protein